jgi:hypothetical protein
VTLWHVTYFVYITSFSDINPTPAFCSLSFRFYLATLVIELVADNKVNKANEVDLLLNSLLVNSINNIKVIIKKEP